MTPDIRFQKNWVPKDGSTPLRTREKECKGKFAAWNVRPKSGWINKPQQQKRVTLGPPRCLSDWFSSHNPFKIEDNALIGIRPTFISMDSDMSYLLYLSYHTSSPF